MNKRQIALFITSMFILTKVAFTQLQLRDGWPVHIDNYTSNGMWRGAKAYEMNDGEFIITAANVGQIKLLDLDGNLFPGWPVTYETPADSGFIINGPVVGDLNGDNIPEFVVKTAYDQVRCHRILTYNIDGTPNTLYSKILYPENGQSIAGSAPTMVDLDQDGDDELLFILDSLYAINDDGTQYHGFPWAINDTLPTLHSGITVGIGEGWNESEPVVFWGTYTKIHARRLGDTEELPGWPVELETEDLFYTPVSLIPRDNGWLAGIVDENYLYLWNQNGDLAEGFPVRNVPVQGFFTDTYDLIVGDIDGDNEPDLMFRPYTPYLHAYDLQGNPKEGFPIDMGAFGSSEPVSIMRDSDSDSAIVFTGNVEENFQEGLHLFRYNQHLVDPLYCNTNGVASHHCNVCLIPPRQGVMQVAFFLTIGELYVYDYPITATEVHFEWQMYGNNPGGNRMYHPNNYVGVEEPEKKLTNDDFEVGTLYPNPGNSFFRMKFKISESGTTPIKITDITGRTVYHDEYEGTPNSMIDWQWDTKDNEGNLLASGVYFIQVGDNTSDIRKAVLIR